MTTAQRLNSIYRLAWQGIHELEAQLEQAAAQGEVTAANILTHIEAQHTEPYPLCPDCHPELISVEAVR